MPGAMGGDPAWGYGGGYMQPDFYMFPPTAPVAPGRAPAGVPPMDGFGPVFPGGGGMPAPPVGGLAAPAVPAPGAMPAPYPPRMYSPYGGGFYPGYMFPMPMPMYDAPPGADYSYYGGGGGMKPAGNAGVPQPAPAGPAPQAPTQQWGYTQPWQPRY